jgi:hypothetical protein
MPVSSVELAASGSAGHSPSRPRTDFLAGAGDRPAIASRRGPRSFAGYTAHQYGVTDGKIEITVADGTTVRAGHDISLVTLRRVLAALRG